MTPSEKMIEALQNNDLENAERHFKDALALDDPETLYGLADALYQLGFLDETKQIYEQLLVLFPEEEELKIGLAEIAIEADELSEAMLLLEEISAESSAYPQALLVLADLYQVQGLYEVSEQKLEIARNLLPDEPIIAFAQAELFFTTGKYAQSIRIYQELLKQGVDEIGGIYLAQRIASSYSALADFENALPYFEQALEQHEEINTLFEYGFTNMQTKQYKRAAEVFSQLKELDPSYTSLYPYLGRALEEEQQLEKALEVMQEGIRLDEFNPELFEYAGKLALKLDNEELAEDYFRQAVLLDPEKVTAALELNNLLLKQERFDDAIEISNIALENEEIDAQFYWNLGIAYEGLEDYEKAYNAYHEAAERFKENKDFLKQYGTFLREDGKLEEAKQILGRYLEMEPNDDEVADLYSSINGESF